MTPGGRLKNTSMVPGVSGDSMMRRHGILTSAMIGLMSFVAPLRGTAGQEPPAPAQGRGLFLCHLADYDSELRRPDGRP